MCSRLLAWFPHSWSTVMITCYCNIYICSRLYGDIPLATYVAISDRQAIVILVLWQLHTGHWVTYLVANLD